MILSKIFNRFVQQAPLTVMARAIMEHALASEDLDLLFDDLAEKQYTRDLLFSSVVDLMGVAVAKIQPSVHAAFQEVKDTVPVSIQALYDKLNGLEPQITGALVSHTAQRLAPVIRATQGQIPALLAGHRVRIIDGNHLAATQRRPKVLRGSVAGPLPGHSLVVLDPELMLATDMIPCEDGHAQERSLTGKILELVNPGDVWVADRNFCTGALLRGIVERRGYYVIRLHANLRILSEGTLRRCGRTETGEVFEQSVTIKDADGELMETRRVIIRLDKPTRDGDAEMSILTNLTKKKAGGIVIAELYRDRWTLETVFQSLTQMLRGEIDTLAYPRAALLGFAVALASYNILSTVQAALRGKFGVEKIQEEVSGFYIANEIRATSEGMSIAIEPKAWQEFRVMTPEQLAARLLEWASHAKLPKYKRHPRGPKKPVPPRTLFRKQTHVSTARLLLGIKPKKAP